MSLSGNEKNSKLAEARKYTPKDIGLMQETAKLN